MNKLVLTTVFLAATSSIWGCIDLPGSLGEQCELNSDCDTPLACRIGFCRVQCTTSRDCALGLDCVQDNNRQGACQLPEETSCRLESDCPENLVCTMGECTNICGCADGEPCEDCPAGAACIARPDGSRACLDTATDSCIYNSECDVIEEGFVCAADNRCREECATDADCRFDDICASVSFQEVGGPAMGLICIDPFRAPGDAGMPDGG